MKFDLLKVKVTFRFKSVQFYTGTVGHLVNIRGRLQTKLYTLF